MKNKKMLKDKKWSKNKNLSIDPTQEIGKQTKRIYPKENEERQLQKKQSRVIKIKERSTKPEVDSLQTTKMNFCKGQSNN